VKGIQVCSNDDHWSFPRGDNCENVKIYGNILKIFFSRTTGPISTKLGPNHPRGKGIQLFPYHDHWSFPRGDTSKNVKITLKNTKKIFFFRTMHWVNFNQTWPKSS
jgi:hypothetical protein